MNAIFNQININIIEKFFNLISYTMDIFELKKKQILIDNDLVLKI